MRKIRYELMQPDEIMKEKEKCPVIYLPIGPLEWHGPHLPMGTDPMIAYEIASRVCQEVGGVILPTFYWGTERERDSETLKNLDFNGDEWIVGMDFPGNNVKSVYLPEEFFALGVRIMLEKMKEQGYRLIVIVNGHGASNQIETLKRLAGEFQNEKGVEVIADFVAVPDKEGVVDYGHATASETSKVMAIQPDTVDFGKLPPPEKSIKYKDYAIVDSKAFLGSPDSHFRVMDDPRTLANQASGETLIKRAVEVISQKVKEKLNKMAER